MAIQDAELLNKYKPPAEQHASVPSSFRSAPERKQRSSVTEMALGTGLPSQFSVEDHVSALPDGLRLGPSREQSPSSDVSWGALAVVAAGVGFAGAEATLFSKVGWKKGLIVNGTVLTGIACLSQPTEANTAITAVASTPTPFPTEIPTMEPTPTGPDGYIWNSELNGWFTSRILNGNLNGGISLIDKKQGRAPTSLSLNIDCKEGLDCPNFQHQDFSVENLDAPTFSNIFYGRLMSRYFEKNFINVPSADRKQYFFDFQDGKVSIRFVGSDGKDYVWKLRDDTNVNEFVITFDQADPAKDTRFFEWSLVGNNIVSKTGGEGDYRSMFIGDVDGNVQIVTSSKKLTSALTEQEMITMLFGPLARLTAYDENKQPTYVFLNDISGKNSSDPAHVEIVPVPIVSPTLTP